MPTEKSDLVIPARLPFLEAICWQINDVRQIATQDMLDYYERGWLYRGVLADLSEEEQTFLHKIALLEGSWLANEV